MTDTVIDSSQTLSLAKIKASAGITVERDAGTPLGDPVNVTIDHLGASPFGTLTVQDNATVDVRALVGLHSGATFDIGTGGSLELDHAGHGSSITFAFIGGGGSLTLGSAIQLNPQNIIYGFGAGDQVAINGEDATYAKVFASAAGGTEIHLYDQSHDYLSTLYFDGAFNASDFTISQDATGTVVSYAGSGGDLLHPPALHGASNITIPAHFGVSAA